MKDPNKVLGIPPGADEATVRRRYLQLVRQHPPDQAPERFAEIRAAYEQLRDPVTRLESEIFLTASGGSLDDIIADVRHRLRRIRIPVEDLLSLGNS